MTAPRDAVVVVVDDDLSVREALDSLLRAAGLRCESHGSAAEFLLAPRPDAPTCLVLDVHLPGESGLDLLRAMRESGASIPVVFITGRATIPMSVQAMKLGAVEFLQKPFGERELLAAIDHALARDEAARAARAEQRALGALLDRLTPRERDVFRLVAAGRMSKEIATELGTALQTVKQQRSRVMQKLGVRSVAELVRLAERGQPPPP